jgi:hypothetical protein
MPFQLFGASGKMRRLAFIALVALACTAGCKRRDKIVVQPTEEEGQALASVVRVADPRMAPQLISGFHDVEQNSWRWTKSKFTVALRPPAGAATKGAKLELKFSLPDAVFTKVGAVTLSAKIGTTELPAMKFPKPGECTYSAEVPATLLNADSVKVEFILDKFLAAGTAEQRELGVVVSTAGFEAK